MPCGMTQRVGKRHSLEGLDDKLVVILRFPPRFLDRILQGEDIFPGLPGVAFGHHPLRVDFTRIDVVDAHALVVLAMEFVVLVFEHARKVLDDVDALTRALQVGRRNGLHRAADRVHLHRLFEAHRFRLRVEGDRLRAEEHGKQHLGVLRDFRQIRNHVLGVERHENRIVDLAAELFDHRLVFPVVAVSPGIVGRDDGPVLAEIFEGPGGSGCGQCIGIRAGAEGIAGALRSRRLGGLARREIDRLQFGRDRDRRQHHPGMDRTNDEVRTIAFDQRSQFAGAGGGIGFGILGDQLDFPPRNAALFVDEPHGRFRRLVVPIAPGRKAAGQFAMAAENDRTARLGVEIAGQPEIGRSCSDAAGERMGQKTPAAGSVLAHLILHVACRGQSETPR